MGVAGTLAEATERLRAYRDAGVDRIMLQHLLHDDLDAIALLARLAAASGRRQAATTAAKRRVIAAACSLQTGT